MHDLFYCTSSLSKRNHNLREQRSKKFHYKYFFMNKTHFKNTIHHLKRMKWCYSNTNFCQLLNFSKQNFLLMKFPKFLYENIWYSHQQHEIFVSLMMQNLKHLKYCCHTTTFLGTLNNVHLKFTFTKMLELWIILFLQYFKVQ